MKVKNNIEVKEFGKITNGLLAMVYTLKNQNGMSVAITNFGGHILAINVPDKNGNFIDITHSADSLKHYEKGNFYGPITGRYANRIGGAAFELDGKTYNIFKNNGQNAIHGGKQGFDKKLWQAEPINGNEPALKLHYLSPDMEEGFPGNLEVTVTYTLTSHNELKIDYRGICDKPTVINLTNHAYFNLAGADGLNNILDHELTIFANEITEFDQFLIPTGQYLAVINTPLDFTKAKRIGKDIDDSSNIQIKYANGYDHCYVFSDKTKKLKLAAIVHEPLSGRVMEMHTSEPGVQLFTANFMNGKQIGKNGVKYNKRSAFCLETQHFPDSPNKPQFPTTVLRPGQIFESTTVYKFSVRK